MDKKTMKSIAALIVFAILFYALVMHFSSVVGFVIGLGVVLLPIVIGLVIAFVLNVPMRAFERLIWWMFRKSKKKPHVKLVYIVSLLLTLICISLVITLVVTLAVPEIIDSGKSIYELLKQKIPQLLAFLEKHDIDTSKISSIIKDVDLASLIDKVGSGA